jgi:hypothetical protein
MLALSDLSSRSIRLSGTIVVLGLLWSLFSPLIAQDSGHSSGAPSAITVDNFEDDSPGSFPEGWVFVESDTEVKSYEESRNSGEIVKVVEENGEQFVRLITKGEALRYTKRNGVDFEWNLNDHPRLKWRWRALTLPEGASEKGQNDTGGAVYVTFGKDWLGRPKSIKYTYSSSLPVGTVVSVEPRQGEWQPVQRHVINDYRQVFGGDPPDEPVSITIWSDSDTTGEEAKVDIDDIELLPPR